MNECKHNYGFTGMGHMPDCELFYKHDPTNDEIAEVQMDVVYRGNMRQKIKEALDSKDAAHRQEIERIYKEQHDIQNGLAKDIQHYTHVAEDVERLEAEIESMKQALAWADEELLRLNGGKPSQLISEIERLKAEKEAYFESSIIEIKARESQLSAHKEALKVAEEVLDKYAKPENWDHGGFDKEDARVIFSASGDNAGYIPAKTALERMRQINVL